MKKNVVSVLLSVGLLSLGLGSEVFAGNGMSAGDARSAVKNAQKVLGDVHGSIEKSKSLVDAMQGDASLVDEMKKILASASEDWSDAVAALENAKAAGVKLEESEGNVAKALSLLTQVNASAAEAQAQLVQTKLYFVEAAATGKTESLDVIRDAVKAAEAAIVQVERNQGLVKSLLAGK